MRAIPLPLISVALCGAVWLILGGLKIHGLAASDGSPSWLAAPALLEFGLGALMLWAIALRNSPLRAALMSRTHLASLALGAAYFVSTFGPIGEYVVQKELGCDCFGPIRASLGLRRATAGLIVLLSMPILLWRKPFFFGENQHDQLAL